MTLRVGEEQVIFTLPEAMKHTLDHDDAYYFTDNTDLIISDCVQEILALNPLDGYLEDIEVEETEERDPSPPPMQQAARMGAGSPPGCKKKKTLKKAWRKANKKFTKSMNISTLLPSEVDRLYFEKQGKFQILSCLSMNFPCGGTSLEVGGNSTTFDPP